MTSETDATIIETLRAEVRIAQQQRDDVTRELEEAKRAVEVALDEGDATRVLTHRIVELKDKLTTARLDTLREVRAWLDETSPHLVWEFEARFIPPTRQEGVR